MIGPEQLHDMIRRLPEGRPSDFIRRRDHYHDRRDHWDRHPFRYTFMETSVLAPEGYLNRRHFEPRTYETRIEFTYDEDYIRGVRMGFWKYGELMVKAFPL